MGTLVLASVHAAAAVAGTLASRAVPREHESVPSSSRSLRASAPEPADVAAALGEMASAIGGGAVLDAEAALEFRDPYDPFDDSRFPGGVVQPATVEELQAVVRIAARRGVPIWATSQGRNNGYGGSAPVVGGSIVVSLRRMDRILEVNEELGYAVVEPGVRFFDLVEELRRRGGNWWTSSPSLGWGSVVGNTLDHGFGYAEYGEHAGHVPDLEVVLPDGELLRTGMWASSTAGAHIHPRGFGPNVTSLFMQSGLGIVTKLARPLMRRPESYAPITIKAFEPGDLVPLIDALRTLRLEGTIRNIPNVTTALGAAAMRRPRRDWYDGGVPLPDEVYRGIMAELDYGWWNATAALYGPARTVDAEAARVREVIERAVPGAAISIKQVPGAELDAALEDGRLASHRERIMAGRPSLVMLETAKWWGEEGGHLEISPIAAATGRDAARIGDILRPIVEAEGFDFWPSIYIVGRSLMQLCVLNYDNADPSRARAAYRVAEAAYPALAREGYLPYRGNIRLMDLMQDQYDWGGHAYRRFVEGLKDALDPAGTLAPGKQGIWSARYRSDPAGRGLAAGDISEPAGPSPRFTHRKDDE